jgi:hypothetical protein
VFVVFVALASVTFRSATITHFVGVQRPTALALLRAVSARLGFITTERQASSALMLMPRTPTSNKLITWLTFVLSAIIAYALVLVVGGHVALDLFSLLGFGPPEVVDTPEFRDYLRLPYMVLGAVITGWSVLMLQIVRGPLRDGAPWAATFLLRAVGIWFVLDTGMSLVLGFPTHAVFNVPFALALGVPLLRMRNK